MGDEEESKGFQVRDRRRFTESGEVREEAAAAPEVAPQSEPTPKIEPAPQPHEHEHGHAHEHGHDHEHDHGHAHGHEGHADRPLEITLGTFLMSLSTQALMCLGEIPNPMSGQPEPDLLAVRELIDIISMLQQKTRGNLDAAEARLFETILYDLRMRFVEKARK